MTPNTLVFDIERFPNISYTWGMWEQNVIKIVREGYVLSWSAKWLGGKHITKGLCDYKGYKGGPGKEKELIADLWKLLDKADIVVAHNGKKFDVRVVNALFYKYKLGVPSPYKVIDTMTIWNKYFDTNSKSLRYIAEYSKIAKKMEHEGFPLWEGCDRGDKKSWRKMKAYNAQDVVVTEQIYLGILPWIDNHPHFKDGIKDCPNCGSADLQKRGTKTSNIMGHYQLYWCMNCHAWPKQRL